MIFYPLCRGTVGGSSRHGCYDGMDHKYIGQWLRRVRKELAISGRLSEIASLLERQYPGANPAWSSQLRQLRNGDWEPDPDQLTCIDAALSRPRKLTTPVAVTPLLLFPMPQSTALMIKLRKPALSKSVPRPVVDGAQVSRFANNFDA